MKRTRVLSAATLIALLLSGCASDDPVGSFGRRVGSFLGFDDGSSPPADSSRAYLQSEPGPPSASRYPAAPPPPGQPSARPTPPPSETRERETPRRSSEPPAATPAPAPRATPTPRATPEPAAISTPTPAAVPPSSTSGGIPFGIPVPGKPGYVTSPHSPGAGYIDVSGMGPGSLAQDPYSGKPFRVP